MSMSVPYLSEEEIERDANALLSEFARKRAVTIAAPVPIEDIVEKYLRLQIEFDDTHKLFGMERLGIGGEPDILGAIFFDEARIVIDEALDPDEKPFREGRYRFTLGHEGGGHWRLHRHLFANDAIERSVLETPASPSVLCRLSQSKERVEWQADYYASCLLMPRHLVLDAWRQKLGTEEPFIFDHTAHSLPKAEERSYKGPRPIGAIMHELDQPDYLHLFDDIAKWFAPIFRVSTLAMRIRLEKLGLLIDNGSKSRAVS